jgi:hypothetical protein
MATLSVQRVSRAGTVITYGAAAGGGDDFPNDGKTVIAIDNADASPITVTFTLAVDPHSAEPTQETTETAITVTNATVKHIGPFPTNKFGTSVAVAYSAVTSVTVAVIAI